MADDRWHQLVADVEGGEVTPGKMFGSVGLRTGTKFFATWWHEQLVVKLPPTRLTALVEAGDGQPFEPMEGRRMTGWILLAETSEWPPLVEEARTFVAAQNASASRPRTRSVSRRRVPAGTRGLLGHAASLSVAPWAL